MKHLVIGIFICAFVTVPVFMAFSKCTEQTLKIEQTARVFAACKKENYSDAFCVGYALNFR